jgi:3',5'-cyclic AMP phosphodiesterase CpdA
MHGHYRHARRDDGHVCSGVGVTAWLAVRRLPLVLPALALFGAVGAGQDVTLPSRPDSLKFAVIGDNGTGDKAEFEVGQQMVAARAQFPFEMVIMLGDNLYGRQQPQDFVDKFQRPYAPLLQAGVQFFAALGNHDDQSNREYGDFHMNGERYYTFVRRGVRFLVLDTNLMDRQQLAWAEDRLSRSHEDWTICYFHHPLYSDGARHGSSVELRVALEPLLVRYGVDVVFSGHDHIYERTKPQKGITYFVEGASGQLRKGNVRPSDVTAAAFDQDQTFMLVEVAGNQMVFRTVSRTGRVVDSGVVHARPST